MIGSTAKLAIRTLGAPIRWINRWRGRTFGCESVKSILVLKPDHLGDLITAAPGVNAVRNEFKTATVTFGGSKAGAELYRTLGLIDEAVEYPNAALPGLGTAMTRVLRARRFDLVINLRHDYRDIWRAGRLGGKYVCTYDHDGMAISATHPGGAPREDRYESENHLDLVRKLGIDTPEFIVPNDKEAFKTMGRKMIGGPWVVMHPGARTKAKQWLPERFSEIVAELEREGFRIACVGSEEDRKMCETIGEDRRGFINLAGSIGFAELFAALRMSSAFVGVDSFVMHAAAAVGREGVAVFSGTNTALRWKPPGIRAITSDVECSPCAKEECDQPGHPCLNSISSDRVFQELFEILKSGGSV
jgi:ADP-heptose:LPS heptosyltransferase